MDERHFKHHVVGRNRHRHRRDGRFGDHHDRERAQSTRTFSRRAWTRAVRRRARERDYRRGQKRRASAVLRSARDHGEFYPCVLAYRAGRPVVPAARVHENVLDVFRLVSRRDARAGTHVAFDSRQNHTGEGQSGEPVFDLGISAVRQLCPALSLVHARVRGASARHHNFPIQKTRERIHASTQ